MTKIFKSIAAAAAAMIMSTAVIPQCAMAAELETEVTEVQVNDSASSQAAEALILGDVNADGNIDSLDATAVLVDFAKTLVGDEAEIATEVGDFNEDTFVNAVDATEILIFYSETLLEDEPAAVVSDPEQTGEKTEATEKDGHVYLYGYDLTEMANSSLLSQAAASDPQPTYGFYNSQSSSNNFRNVAISESDWDVLKNFANSNFKGEWSREVKVAYTFIWIHTNVDYAYAGTKWNTIVNKGYADAIFNYRMGQCAQYNGALAEMMAYLGYEDVNLVQGYYARTSNQHFFTEVKINGKLYTMCTGNRGKNGTWMTFCVPYENDKFIKLYDWAP